MELETIEIPDMVKLESMAEANRTTLFLLFLQILRIDYKNPAVFGVAEQLGRCYGILDYVRKIPFSLRYHRVTVPQDLLDKHNLTLRNMWDRVYGKANEDLFDVVLEVAAYAREHLLQAIALNDKLPPHAFRAFLYGVTLLALSIKI
jgi:NADH dehydrogenase [ubiquinone] 1 alpha subcomplex assembly factor 6